MVWHACYHFLGYISNNLNYVLLYLERSRLLVSVTTLLQSFTLNPLKLGSCLRHGIICSSSDSFLTQAQHLLEMFSLYKTTLLTNSVYCKLSKQLPNIFQTSQRSILLITPEILYLFFERNHISFDMIEFIYFDNIANDSGRVTVWSLFIICLIF